MTQIANVVLISARNPGPFTGSGNNTWLLPGREPALIDAGVGKSEHLDAIEAALAGAPLARVLVTHGHSDHASGVEAIARRWPGVAFLKWLWPESDKRYRVSWTAVADGDRVSAGDTQLTIVHTPGHSPDHICFFEASSRVMFCGDLVMMGSSVLIPGTRGGSLAAYLTSLRNVLGLQPARLLPAHGEPVDDVATLLRSYLNHRLLRERQVLEALATGPQSAAVLVARIYVGIRDELMEAAQETVLAHLFKLQEENMVTCDDSGLWRLR